MPSYRPPISRDQYHDLEIYYFRLVMFTDSWDYKQLKSPERSKIDYEITYMSMAIDIMRNLFAVKGGTERRVVAWKEEPVGDYDRLFVFSCIKVAAKCLDCNQSKISAVCKGLRRATGGYIFQYEEDYDRDQHLNFDAGSSKFEFK